MGIVRFGAPREILSWIADEFGVETFVETGTNRAETAIWASSKFDRVVTIEGHEPLYREAVRNNRSRKNIEFVLGDSRTRLKELMPSLTKPTIFWLDAHWCGTETFGFEHECPIEDELAAINSSSVEHFILIDDARLFLYPPPKPHNANDWPDMIEVCGWLASAAGRYAIVHEDAIIAVPNAAKTRLIEYARMIGDRTGDGVPSKPRRALRAIRRLVRGD